jgi:hypothetical protein
MIKMLKKINPFLPYATAGLVVIGLGVVSFSANQSTTEAIEETAQAFEKCYPSTYEKPLSVASLPADGATIWEVEAYSHDQNVSTAQMLHFRTKLKDDRMMCAWLNRNQAAYRTDYLDKEMAIAFAKQRYEPVLKECIALSRNIDGCKQELVEGLSGTRNNPGLLYPEDIHALKQLGVDTNLLRRVRLIRSVNDLKT